MACLGITGGDGAYVSKKDIRLAKREVRDAQTIEEKNKAQAKLDSLRDVRKKQPVPMNRKVLPAGFEGALHGAVPKSKNSFINFNNNSVNTLQDAQNLMNKIYGDK